MFNNLKGKSQITHWLWFIKIAKIVGIGDKFESADDYMRALEKISFNKYLNLPRNKQIKNELIGIAVASIHPIFKLKKDGIKFNDVAWVIEEAYKQYTNGYLDIYIYIDLLEILSNMANNMEELMIAEEKRSLADNQRERNKWDKEFIDRWIRLGEYNNIHKNNLERRLNSVKV